MAAEFVSTGILEAASEEEVTDVDLDGDGGYASGSERALSIASSIFDYRYENGRRYHGFQEGRYFMPNDNTEQDRLDVVHHLFRILLNGSLHMTPFEEPPTRVLDVGTGTGIWAIDMATENESAEVIGTDLSPIQPEWVPPNCRFEIDDAEAEWAFSKDSFDFIHSRHLGTSIKDWPRYIQQIYNHLRPGGWVELVEHENDVASDDGTLNENSTLKTFYSELRLALDTTGRDPYVPAKLKGLLEEHGGFTHIREVQLKLPFGPWPRDRKNKELGRWTSIALDTGFEAYGLALFRRVLEKPREQAKQLIQDAMAETKDRKIHCYAMQYFVVAKKPHIDPQEGA